MVNRTSGYPPRRQIADALRAQILAGEYGPGDQLPSYQELMDRWEVANKTALAALDVLRGEGLITGEVGRGSFVRRRPQRIRRLITDLLDVQTPQAGFYAALGRYGLTPQVNTTVIDGLVPSWAAPELGIDETTTVVVRDRIMGATDGPPFQLATSCIPLDVADRAPQLRERSTGPGGMLARLRDAGYVLHFEVVDWARMPTPIETKTMQLPPGVPVQELLRLTKAQDNRVLDAMRIVSDSARVEWAYRFGPESDPSA